MNILKFNKYCLFSLIKTKGFWICSILYFVINILFNYLFPAIEDKHLFDLYNNQIAVLTSFILLIVVIASYNTIHIFKSGFENGEEILLQVKPLTKPLIIWTKTFVIIELAFFYGLCTIVFNSFLFLTTSHSIALSVLIGGFVGTFINYLFWSGITISLCTFFNKTIVFIVVLSISIFFQFITMIFTFLTTVPTKAIKKEQSITLDAIRMYEVNDANKLTYDKQLLTIPVYKNQPISQNMHIDNNRINFKQTNVSEYYQNIYWDEVNKNGIKAKSYLDVTQVLLSLYYAKNDKDVILHSNVDETLHYTNSNYVFYPVFQKLTIDPSKFQNVLGELFLVTNIKDNFYDYKEKWPSSLINPVQPVVYPYFNLTTNKIEPNKTINSLTEFNNLYFSDEQIALAKKFKVFHKAFATYYNWILSSDYMSKNNLNIYQFMHSEKDKINVHNVVVSFYYHTFQLIKDYFEHAHQDDVNYINTNYPSVSTKTLQAWFDLFELNKITFKSEVIEGTTVYKLADLNTIKNPFKKPQITTMLSRDNVEKITTIINTNQNYKNIFNDGIVDEILFYQYKHSQKIDLMHVNNLEAVNITFAANYYDNQALIAIIFFLIACALILISANIIYKKDIF